MGDDGTAEAVGDQDFAPSHLDSTRKSLHPERQFRPLPVILLHARHIWERALQMRLPMRLSGTAETRHDYNGSHDPIPYQQPSKPNGTDRPFEGTISSQNRGTSLLRLAVDLT